MEFLKQFAITLGGTVAAIAAVAWLARSIITHLLSKDVETYKARLKSESDLETERLRASLRRIAYEHEVTFNKLHSERAEVVKTLHAKLIDLISAVEGFVSPFEWANEPPKEEKRKLLAERSRDFTRFFEEHSILLSQDLYDKVREFLDKLLEPALQFAEATHDEGSKRMEVWQQSWVTVGKVAPTLKQQLRQEFRQVLGA